MGINETRAVLRLIKSLAENGFGVLLSVIIWIRSLTYLIVSALCQGEIVGQVKTDEVDPQDVVAMITGAAVLRETSDDRGSK